MDMNQQEFLSDREAQRSQPRPRARISLRWIQRKAKPIEALIRCLQAARPIEPFKRRVNLVGCGLWWTWNNAPWLRDVWREQHVEQRTRLVPSANHTKQGRPGLQINARAI